MKILFMRHGESQDDLENRYGGWGDFPLTAKGTEQIKSRLSSIKELMIPFEKIYSSPLKRAESSARILSEAFHLPLEILEYIKEQNSYGILTGMEKTEAKSKYPDQVELLDSNKFVDGSERSEDLTKRVKRAINIIKKTGHENLIVVTHGKFLNCLFNEILGFKLTKKEDGGWVVINFDNSKAIPGESSGISYEPVVS